MTTGRWWSVDVADRIAVLTFSRPPRNWMSLAAMTELADALEDLATRTGEVTVVVLTGGVDGYFHRPVLGVRQRQRHKIGPPRSSIS